MNRTHRMLVAAAALAAVVHGGDAKAVLMVDGTVEPIGGGAFHYALTVDNDTADELAIITLDAPFGDPLIGASLTGPPGFVTSYDDVLGFLDLLADTAFFVPGSVVGPFEFDSLTGIGDGFFTTVMAITTLGDLVDGEIRLTPAQAAVAEPALPALLLTGLLPLLAVPRRGRAHHRN